MKAIPKTIWLQWHDGDITAKPGSYDAVTWCTDKVNDDDIEYTLPGGQPMNAILDGMKAWMHGLKTIQPASVLEALEQILTAHEGEWTSVEDRLPKPNQKVRVLTDGENPTATYYHKGGKWIVNIKPAISGVTHWQSLPTPPEEDKS